MNKTELGKAYGKLQEDDKKTIKKFYTTVKRPSKKFLIKDFNIPQTRTVKCTEKKFSKVLAFIDSKKKKPLCRWFYCNEYCMYIQNDEGSLRFRNECKQFHQIHGNNRFAG